VDFEEKTTGASQEPSWHDDCEREADQHPNGAHTEMGERTSRHHTGSGKDPLSALSGAAGERALDSAPRVTASAATTDVATRSERPLDWPGVGPIDLDVHDLPHASSTTEWWYMNGHATTREGRRFSLFAAFFRQQIGREQGKDVYAHSVTWALVDVERSRYLHSTGVDPSAPREGLKRLKGGLGSTDGRLNRALAEMLERGVVPKPDRIMQGRIHVGERQLELDYSGATFKKLDDGTYHLRLLDERGFGCDVVFTPKKPVQRHGRDGVVRGSDNELMFYYFIPRCELTGNIVCDGHAMPIAEGQGWYDHEFGRREQVAEDFAEDDTTLDPELRTMMQKERRARKEKNAVAWDWLSAQLDDGTDVTLYPLTYLTRGESAGSYAIVIDAEGRREVHTDLVFEPLQTWQSTQTFFEYPTQWRCRIPSANIDLEVNATFEDQEFITLISKPSFWEGRVEVTGLRNGQRVRGLGFIERSGFTPFDDLEGFFNAVGRVVRRSIDQVIPLNPTYEHARELIGTKERDQYMDGLDVEQLARTLIRPIREITDRGGKGWRSYAAITCCDLVGGDSRDFVQWLALPEMMHVGSLIIDDVQDKSAVRRGGPAAHLLYGDSQCINSGTAAYFIGNHLLVTDKISDEKRVRIYELYFEALRAGHAGQAIDLDGFDWLMPAIVESGKGDDLERRVLAVHRLKTAAPAACLARMGAIAGGGSSAQIEGLGGFFEALGLSFQIIDDVLNLRGFRGELKSKGEDVMQGKVTLPVAKAMGRLGRVEREWLWSTLSSKPQDPEVVGRVIALLEECGAIEDCAQLARDLLENAWKRLEPLVEDSLAKLMLRAFSWFVLERHY
jgi:geranylgeranyl pyrophosphate synthase/predicted secreted hydrolase